MFNIPLWVYAVFLGLLYIGIGRCFTRVIHVRRLALVPVLFVYFGLHSSMHLFGLSLFSLCYLLFGSIVGLLLGYFQARNKHIQADKKRKLIRLPGDLSMLVTVMVAFFIEFIIRYSLDAHLSIAHDEWFKLTAVLASGIIMGISVGRNSTFFYKYVKSESIKLTLS